MISILVHGDAVVKSYNEENENFSSQRSTFICITMGNEHNQEAEFQ